MINIPNEFNGLLPELPITTDEDIQQYKKNNDFFPLAFKWSRYCGILSIRFASISIDSPTIDAKKQILHINILQGLINRCSRLLAFTIHLAQANKFDETIRIIARCLNETIVKIQWLTVTKQSSTSRYLLLSTASR